MASLSAPRFGRSWCSLSSVEANSVPSIADVCTLQAELVKKNSIVHISSPKLSKDYSSSRSLSKSHDSPVSSTDSDSVQVNSPTAFSSISPTHEVMPTISEEDSPATSQPRESANASETSRLPNGTDIAADSLLLNSPPWTSSDASERGVENSLGDSVLTCEDRLDDARAVKFSRASNVPLPSEHPGNSTPPVAKYRPRPASGRGRGDRGRGRSSHRPMLAEASLSLQARAEDNLPEAECNQGMQKTIDDLKAISQCTKEIQELALGCLGRHSTLPDQGCTKSEERKGVVSVQMRKKRVQRCYTIAGSNFA